MTSTLQQLRGEPGELPRELYYKLPPILKEACSYYDHDIERDAFLHGALPVLSRIMENCVIPLRSDDERLAIQVWVYGVSGKGKGPAGHAPWLLKHIRQQEDMNAARAEAAHKNAEPDEEGNVPAPPTLHDMTIGLRSTPTTWIRRMKRHPERVVHLVADTEGDTIKGGYSEHGSLRPLIKKGYGGEMEQFTLKEDGNITVEVWLSVLVTMTQRQMLDAIKDTEDGFFQRFVFLKVPQTESVFRDPFLQDDNESIKSRLVKLGMTLADHYEVNRQRKHDLRIRFTAEQQADHRSVFSELLPVAVKEHPNLHGSIVRLASTTLRVAGLFTMLRTIHPEECTEVICDHDSWTAACILRDYWNDSIQEAFNLFDNSSTAMDGRSTIPDVVKNLVVEWRKEGIMPKEAEMKLRQLAETNIDVEAWLKRTKDPHSAIGRLQRQANRK